MKINHIDFLVVGAGPVGLFCATELARHGLDYRIIDKKMSISTHSKALGIHIRTLDMLEDCGLYDLFVNEGIKITGILVNNNHKTLVEMDFENLQSSRNFLLDLPQDKTERILYERLMSSTQTVEWQVELLAVDKKEEHSTQVQLRHRDGLIEVLNARYIIACDGAHSSMRHLLGLNFIGSAYPQTWWLADLHIEWDFPENKMVVYPSKFGPLACFPMGNNRYRLVLTAEDSTSETLSLRDIQKAFFKRSSNPARLYDPIWITPFSIHHRQIPSYDYGNIFFCGDSAHIHSPMGGQGLNTGMQDVYNLVWKLSLVHQEIAKVSLLRTYNEERYPIGKNILQKTDTMTRLILIKNSGLIAIRNHIMRLIMSIPYFKRTIMRGVAELDISYAKTSQFKQIGKKTAIKLGQYLPDFQLYNKKTASYQTLQTICQGTAYHLFLIANIEQYENSILQSTQSLECYAKWLQIHVIDLETDQPLAAFTADPTLDLQFMLNQSCAMLVRPDKYISLIQSPIDGIAIKDYLTHYLVL